MSALCAAAVLSSPIAQRPSAASTCARARVREVGRHPTRPTRVSRVRAAAAAGTAGGGGAGLGAVVEVGLRVRVRCHWTMRFFAWDVETRYATAAAALVGANNGESVSIYTDWNNMSD